MSDDKNNKIVRLDETPLTLEPIDAVRQKFAKLRKERKQRLVAELFDALAAMFLEASDATQAHKAPVLVDEAEAAQLLGITVAALRSRRVRGQVPAGSVVRTGRRRIQYKVQALRDLRPYTKRQ